MAILHDEEFAYFNAKIVELIKATATKYIDEIMVETGVTYEYEGE